MSNLWVFLFVGIRQQARTIEGIKARRTVVAVVASSLGNTGPTLGDYGPSNTWASMGTPSLIITSILMWFGRLELMTALLLLHPRTWAREEREAPDRASVKLIRELFEKMEDRSEDKD